MNPVRLTVEPIPLWLDAARLLAPASLSDATRTKLDAQHERVELTLPVEQAATVATRLRGLGLDGSALEVTVRPPLSREHVRSARLQDARARRDTTIGFLRPGARATGEGRFSLTPETLAFGLGKLAQGGRVVDACCGSGGNAIGFARAGCHVLALELDPARLLEARHNAALYGVSERIAFAQADALEVVPSERADILFVDPPWGEQYDKRVSGRDDFPLLRELLARDLSGYGELWLKLPSSFCVASVANAEASAWFGTAPGDAHRLKFVLLRKRL